MSHDNRDIDFILLKRSVAGHLTGKFGAPCQFNAMSCEMIARLVKEKFNLDAVSVAANEMKRRFK